MPNFFPFAAVTDCPNFSSPLSLPKTSLCFGLSLPERRAGNARECSQQPMFHICNKVSASHTTQHIIIIIIITFFFFFFFFFLLASLCILNL
jgi:hypothetical protein